MELKFETKGSRGNFLNSSNRTFMELKLGLAAVIIWWKFCSNRTFMELKYNTLFHNICAAAVVLIVPLWN